MIILAVIAGALALWLMFTYNSLVKLKNQTLNALKQIDVQLKRRHDLIPNLVSSVKGEMKFEQDTLEKVINARARAINAAQSGNMKEAFENENIITQGLSKIMALSENYPNLKSNEQVKQLMEELSHTENTLAFARQFYNDIATKFNIAQQTFPNNMIASALGFGRSELFELPADSKERENPKVDLTI
ncbi:MAG: LemA family protein [Elusimicrobia bacterium]|nr:LemA family protein [Elusimicrobiota bacterium]